MKSADEANRTVGLLLVYRGQLLLSRRNDNHLWWPPYVLIGNGQQAAKAAETLAMTRFGATAHARRLIGRTPGNYEMPGPVEWWQCNYADIQPGLRIGKDPGQRLADPAWQIHEWVTYERVSHRMLTPVLDQLFRPHGYNLAELLR